MSKVQSVSGIIFFQCCKFLSTLSRQETLPLVGALEFYLLAHVNTYTLHVSLTTAAISARLNKLAKLYSSVLPPQSRQLSVNWSLSNFNEHSISIRSCYVSDRRTDGRSHEYTKLNVHVRAADVWPFLVRCFYPWQRKHLIAFKLFFFWLPQGSSLVPILFICRLFLARSSRPRNHVVHWRRLVFKLRKFSTSFPITCCDYIRLISSNEQERAKCHTFVNIQTIAPKFL